MSDNNTMIIPGSIRDFVNGDGRDGNSVKQKTKLICGFYLILISVALIITLYHPSKPKFILEDATVFTFDLSTDPPNFLNSSLQITLSYRNPNDKFGIYYDGLGIYAEYKNQKITDQTDIPRVYQGHKETNIWSWLVNGTDVPIAPHNLPFLTMDQSCGIINLDVKLDGHIRWRIGPFITRKYHIHVSCNANMKFGGNLTKSNGVFMFSSIKYRLDRRCSVSV